MAEYIEREKALNVCEMHYQHCLAVSDWQGDSVAYDIKTDIKTIPTADVVEVVRCKDCKQLKNNTEYCKTHNKYYCELDNAIKERNHYCSYGERKQPTERQSVSFVKGHIERSNRCVSCGAEIPEGTWTCPSCERRWG